MAEKLKTCFFDGKKFLASEQKDPAVRECHWIYTAGHHLTDDETKIVTLSEELRLPLGILATRAGLKGDESFNRADLAPDTTEILAFLNKRFTLDTPFDFKNLVEKIANLLGNADKDWFSKLVIQERESAQKHDVALLNSLLTNEHFVSALSEVEKTRLVKYTTTIADDKAVNKQQNEQLLLNAVTAFLEHKQGSPQGQMRLRLATPFVGPVPLEPLRLLAERGRLRAEQVVLIEEAGRTNNLHQLAAPSLIVRDHHRENTKGKAGVVFNNNENGFLPQIARYQGSDPYSYDVVANHNEQKQLDVISKKNYSDLTDIEKNLWENAAKRTVKFLSPTFMMDAMFEYGVKAEDKKRFLVFLDTIKQMTENTKKTFEVAKRDFENQEFVLKIQSTIVTKQIGSIAKNIHDSLKLKKKEIVFEEMQKVDIAIEKLEEVERKLGTIRNLSIKIIEKAVEIQKDVELRKIKIDEFKNWLIEQSLWKNKMSTFVTYTIGIEKNETEVEKLLHMLNDLQNSTQEIIGIISFAKVIKKFGPLFNKTMFLLIDESKIVDEQTKKALKLSETMKVDHQLKKDKLESMIKQMSSKSIVTKRVDFIELDRILKDVEAFKLFQNTQQRKVNDAIEEYEKTFTSFSKNVNNKNLYVTTFLKGMDDVNIVQIDVTTLETYVVGEDNKSKQIESKVSNLIAESIKKEGFNTEKNNRDNELLLLSQNLTKVKQTLQNNTGIYAAELLNELDEPSSTNTDISTHDLPHYVSGNDQSPPLFDSDAAEQKPRKRGRPPKAISVKRADCASNTKKHHQKSSIQDV